MARLRKQPAARSRMIPVLLCHLRERGVDVPRLVQRLGLPRDAERANEVAIAPRDFERLLASASAELNDPLLAVRLPAMLEAPSYNLGELAARSSPTLRDALERAARYAPLFYAPLSFELEDRGDQLVILQRLRDGQRGGRFGSEYGIAATLAHACRMTNEQLKPRGVWFSHPPVPVPDVEALRRFFGTHNVDFNRAENGISFSQKDADRPLCGADSRLLRTADELAERALEEHQPERDFVGTVVAELRRAWSKQDADAAAIARRLRLGTRTLQRRLSDRGTTFSELRARVSREVVEGLVGDASIPLGEVAHRAGFCDQATFGRAFKRWTGSSPSVYRARRG